MAAAMLAAEGAGAQGDGGVRVAARARNSLRRTELLREFLNWELRAAWSQHDGVRAWLAGGLGCVHGHRIEPQHCRVTTANDPRALAL